MQAEIEPVQQSYLSWIFNSLGLFYGTLLPLLALVTFAMTLVLVAKGKGPMVGPALLLIVPVPMLLGFFGAIQGAIKSCTVISLSNVPVKASELALGISGALVLPMFGMLLMAPSFAVALFGMFLRSLLANSDQSANLK